MSLQESSFRRYTTSVLNYLQIGFSIFATTQFPGWISGGYLSDCFVGPVDWLWGFCIPLWLPVGFAVFGSLIGGLLWTWVRKKNTGNWF
jgi:hypothetical protein